jgi:hypothetical protein
LRVFLLFATLRAAVVLSFSQSGSKIGISLVAKLIALFVLSHGCWAFARSVLSHCDFEIALLPSLRITLLKSFSNLTLESVTTPPVCYCALLIHHQQGVSGNRALNTVIFLISLPNLDDNSIIGIEILLQYILLELSNL